MYRRTTRSASGKSDDASNLLQKDSDGSETRSNRPHNPFQSPRPHASKNKPVARGNLSVFLVVFASICCLIPLLTTIITLKKKYDTRTKIQTSRMSIAPRTFQHDDDGWFLPHVEVKTRIHQRDVHKTRIKRQEELNERINVVLRRRISQSIIPHGHDEAWTEPLPPIVNDEDESSEDSSNSKDNDKTKAEYEYDDSKDHIDGLDIQSQGVDCELEEWMKANPVACNQVHETVTDDSLTVLGCGGDRCAFKVTDMMDNNFVLKAPRFSGDRTRKHWEWNRKDVLVMEHLTSSPYVVDIYGYCGLSHFEELGGNGNLHDQVKLAREHKQELSPLDKLRICVQITTAVAHMHELGVAHNDICCHQIILIDGIFKLNDFNFATFQRRNKRTNVPCRDPQINWNDFIAKMRSPEEVGEPWHDHWYYDLLKVDDYMVGNVMFYLLTTHWTFEGYSVKESVRMMRRGQRSKMPKEFLDSQDPAIQAMVEAIRSCWKQNPFERPSARDVADFLSEELRQIEQIDNLGVIRVSVPPLPKSFRFTDSDFHDNLVLGYPGQDDLFFNNEHLAGDDHFGWEDSSSGSDDENN